MSEEAPEVKVDAPVTNEAPEPTLEDVYKDAGVDLQPQPQQTPQQPPQHTYTPPSAPATPTIPDPYDSENFKAFLQAQMQNNALTQDAVRQISGFISQQQQREQKAALEADLTKAVETVNQVVNHPKPKVIEAMLDAKAREDSRFKALWDNRSKNPQAWNNALKAVSKQFAEDLSVKVDPKLVESQRARKIAQGQMATTDAPRNETEEWESMSLEEQNARYDRLLHGGM